MSKLYYDDPIEAAMTHKELRTVRYIDSNGMDISVFTYRFSPIKFVRLEQVKKLFGSKIETHEHKEDKLYVHPDSYHLFNSNTVTFMPKEEE